MCRCIGWETLGPVAVAVAEGLLHGHTARAPVIILRTKNGVLDWVGANLGLHRERLLSELSLKAALIVVSLELVDGDALVAGKVRMEQAFLEVGVALTPCHPRGLVSGVEVAILFGTLKLGNIGLELSARGNLRFSLICVPSWAR